MDLKQAIGAALAAGAFVTVPVVAADTSANADFTDRAEQVFTRLDKNSDGNIDSTEAAARPWLQQGFSQYDTNHDGKLGKDEFAAAHSAQRTARRATRGAAGSSANSGQYFDSIDKNNDGKLDTTEAQALPWLPPKFSQADTDHNGTLGKDEFAAAVSAQGPSALTPSAAAGGTSAASAASQSFESLDKNSDGNIDATEAAAASWLQPNFSQYDTDHNGKLGKDEYAAAQKAQPH
jgi:Ca2+-binding EF-hand superfamily protein